MPEIQDLQPFAVQPDWQQKQAAAQARKLAEPDSFKEIGTAALMQGPVAYAYNAIARDPALWQSDPTWSLSTGTPTWKELTDGLDPAYWPQLADAVSYTHAHYIREIGMQRQQYRETLAAAGATGTAATIVASIADPVYLAAGLASGGIGALSATTRLGQLARAGIVSGAAFGGIEAFKRDQDPVITPSEVALAGLSGAFGTVASEATAGLNRGVRFLAGGVGQTAPQAVYDAFSDRDRQDIMLNILPQFFLGGAMGALGPSEHARRIDKVARNAMKEVEREVVKQSEVTITPKGEDYFRPIDHITEQEKFDLAMGKWSPFEQALGIDRSNPEKVTVSVPVEEVPQTFADLLKEPKSDFQKLLDGEPTAAPRKLVEVEVPIRPSELTFEDTQRIIAQLEAEASPITPFGQELGSGESISTSPVHIDISEAANVVVARAASRKASIEELASSIVAEHGLNPEDYGAVLEEAKRLAEEHRKLDEEFILGAPRTAIGAASPNDPGFGTRTIRGVEKINEQPGDLNLNNVGDDPASFRRWSAAGMTARAENPYIRRAAKMLGIDHVPDQGGMVAYTAADAADTWHQANMSELFGTTDRAYREYALAEKAAGREPMRKLAFMEAATDAYELGRPSGNAHIDQVVDRVRAIRKADWERAQRHGVAGIADGEFDPNVIDRYTDRQQLDELIGVWGKEAVIKDVMERIRRHPGNAHLTASPVDPAAGEAKIRAIAKAWVDHVSTQPDRISAAAAHSFDTDRVAVFAEKLRRAVPELTDAQINDIVWATGPNPNDGSTPPKLRRQVRMDSTWKNPKLDGFSLNDITVRNIEEIARRNSRYINGRSAMAEVFRQFSTPDRKIESTAQLIDYLKSTAEKFNVNPDALKYDLSRIQFMSNLVLGAPTHPTTMFTRISRIVRNASYAHVINTATGLRNFMEIAGNIMENGIGAISKQLVPALGDLFEKVRNGTVDNAASRDMHQMGIAVGELSHRTLPTPEEGEYVPAAGSAEAKFDKALVVADKITQKLANWTSVLSLVGPGQTALERLTYRLVAQRWLDMATGHAPHLTEARMGAATLTPEMYNRIIAQLQAPGTVAYDATPMGNVWAGFNWDRWTDTEAARSFRQSIIKTNRRQVYRPHASELSQWMSTDAAKVLTQLRTFMLGSYESKTLFNLKMADRTAFLSMSAQLMAKAMSYYAITQLYSLGQPNREKYLRDRLTDKKVALAAINGAEFTSIIPMGVDAVQAIRGREPVFAFARTTGLGDQPGLSGLLMSNPTADTIDKVARAIGTPINKINDQMHYRFGDVQGHDPRITQRDIKAVQGGLPWMKMWGVDQLYRRILQNAPVGSQ